MVECTPDKRKDGRSIRLWPITLKMPQFDVSSFFNQVVWLAVFFSGFYFLIVGFLLPDVASGLKARQKKEKSELLLNAEGVRFSNFTKLSIGLTERVLFTKSSSGFSSAL